MSTPLALRLPDGLAKDLDAVARTTDRSKTYHIVKALELYLAEQADYRVALDRLRDKDDEVISSAAMRKRLGRKG